MKKNLLYLMLAVLALGGPLTGCDNPPAEELEQAQQALARAAEAQADVYAAEPYQAAEQALRAGQAEVAAQDDKFALTRNYDQARELLVAAARQGTAAAEQAAARKETLRLEAETLIQETKGMMERLDQGARRSRNAATRAAMQRQVSSVDSLLQAADAAFREGDVARAHELITSANGQANALMAELMKGKARSRRD